MSGYPTGKHSANGRLVWAAFAVLVLALPISCKKSEYPKPKAYPRIDYPSNQYLATELEVPPVSFEYPTYATLVAAKPENKNWINLHFVNFNATLYMSYIATEPKKADLMVQAREKRIIEQAPPASNVRKEEFEAADNRFTGYFYLTDGNAPSPIQFILTNHNGLLFDGSLVFAEPVNRDSLASVIDGLTRDVRHLVETFRFKN